MTDELLRYYERELAYIRNLGAQFAAAHPKIAARLKIQAEASGDPHVERLIEAFAFLNARIRHKLDDDFPEIAEAMLQVLYPHYLAPLPSMAIVKFVLDASQGGLLTGYTIPRASMLETESIDGEPCRFQTTSPVTLWPITLDAARLSGPPFSAPVTAWTPQTAATIQLELVCYNKDLTFAQLKLPCLRFFLRGQTQHVYTLYELMMNNMLGVAAANSPRDPRPQLLPPGAIRAVGFERDEQMLPYTARTPPGCRLLTELFAFPEKFLFFDLRLPPAALQAIGPRLSLFFYLNQTNADLERNVSSQTFQLGCAPIVNLFRQRADSIRLTQTAHEYRVTPDARRPVACEVYSIDRVAAVAPDNSAVEFQPFYSVKHGSDGDAQRTFWHAVRRPANLAAGKVDAGTEVFVSLVDLEFSPAAPADCTLDIETTCLNRDLPRNLPFGGGEPRLSLTAGGPASRIECLTRPTPTYRPELRHGALWRLVSHLSLNHLSLVADDDGAHALREILKLYDLCDSAETRGMIDGIVSLRSRRVVGRTADAVSGGFCRGVEMTVHFDESRFTGHGVFLFASVLERFLGSYCSINSFCKLVVTTRQRESPLRKWAPRAGEKILI